jgi:hypothetical protein
MAEAGVVNHVVADDALLGEAEAFARKISKGPTRAHAADKALLRAWSVGGVAAADETIFDIAVPLRNVGRRPKLDSSSSGVPTDTARLPQTDWPQLYCRRCRCAFMIAFGHRHHAGFLMRNVVAAKVPV